MMSAELRSVFNSILEFINDHEYDGACHDTSAVFFIILQEINIPSTLCIGEIKYKEQWIDHSWVEIDNQVFDIAISRPNISSCAQPPVFASLCEQTGNAPLVEYASESPCGFDQSTLWISEATLGEYSDNHPSNENHLWDLAVCIAENANIVLDRHTIKRKYCDAQRTVKRL